MADITQGPPNMNSPGLFDIQNYLASLQGSGAQPSAPIAANPRQYTSPAGPPAADTSNPFISDLAGLAKYNKGQDANNLAAQMFMGADDNSPVAPSAAPAVDKYGNKVVYDPDNLTPKIDDARSKALALLQQAQATPAPKMAGMTLPQAALQILAGGLDRSGRTGAGFDQGLNAQDKTAYENAMQQFGHTQQGLQQQAGSLSSTAQALQDAIQKRYATDVGFQGRLQPTLARVGGLLDVQNLQNTNAQTVEQMKQ